MFVTATILPRRKLAHVDAGPALIDQALVTAQRGDSGKVFLTLCGRPEHLVASRLHTHLFKGM